MDEIKTRFAIFGLERSGTTLISRLLDSHREILCMEEILQPVSTTCHTVYPIPRYQLYREQSVRAHLLSKVAKEYALRRYLDWLFETYRNEAVGFKLMLIQLQVYPHVAEYMQKKRFKIIHIVRENLLKLHVSYFRAQKTNVWVSNKPVAHRQLELPVQDLVERLRELENKQRTQAQAISQMQLPYTRVTYEQLAQDHGKTLLPALELLGVDTGFELNTEVRKITSDDLSEVILNYQEVSDALASTEYAQFLA